METFTTYKISSEPQTDLFIPPPYCGKVESKIKEKDKMYYEEVPVPKLEVSHPGKLLELTENLTDGNTKLLEVKINRYLKTESGSHTVFLINLKSVAEQAVVQVVYDRILENIVSKPLIEESIAHIVEYKDNYLKCLDNLDPNIQCLLEEILPENSGEVLIFPVLSKDHKSHNCPAKSLTVFPVFLVCFVNPSEDDAYLSRLVHETFRYCLTLMLNTRGREEENRMKKQCQSLLTVARKLFARLADLNDLLREIMSEARRLTNAERCSLFLLDPDHMHLVAKVFDGISSDEKTTEVRIAKDQGIAAGDG